MVAAHFAWKFGKAFGDPALYTVTVPAHDVLFYSNERDEEEFVVMLSRQVKPAQIALPDEDTIQQWWRTQMAAQFANTSESLTSTA